jgi:zinc transport system ATP-binding protein
MALIQCRDAAFAYEGNIAVSGLNFEVNAGDCLCVVGENGSGKSTLIKGLLRLKAPQRGRIETDRGLRPDEIGYLPQQTAAQKDFPERAFEVVLSGRLGMRGARPFYSKADKAAANEVMMRFMIRELANRCYRELSGGQQQRVLLARALCAGDHLKLLLLDEPSSGLDPIVTHDLYDRLLRVNSETGLTIIMVSHDIVSAVKCASHILHLRGEQIFFGTAARYKDSGIGAAYMKGGGRSDDY